jgi:nucleotide-binding universal stress UspA family protein
VVIASHGHGNLHSLLIGSVADRVIRMAACPVLTVKAA